MQGLSEFSKPGGDQSLNKQTKSLKFNHANVLD